MGNDKVKRAFGKELQLNLYNCNPDFIRSRKKILEFNKKLCDLIEMRRFGKPKLIRFGDDPFICGYSLAQLIETSLVSAHFAEANNNVYLNVFSCKDFDAHSAILFAERFFECKKSTHELTTRY